MPMPDRILTNKEREDISATRLVAKGAREVNKEWTAADAAFVRTAAEQPEVERVLVNPAIKKEMCKLEGKHHYAWMSKLRPWYGHADHIHVRLKCPANSPHCRHQPPVPERRRLRQKGFGILVLRQGGALEAAGAEQEVGKAAQADHAVRPAGGL